MTVGQKLCWPILEGYERLNLGATAGAALVKSGQLKTFMIGARRYVTEAELQRFIAKRMREYARETAEDRAKRTAKPTEASLKARRDRRHAAAA